MHIPAQNDSSRSYPYNQAHPVKRSDFGFEAMDPPPYSKKEPLVIKSRCRLSEEHRAVQRLNELVHTAEGCWVDSDDASLEPRTVAIIQFQDGPEIQYQLFRSEKSKILRGFGWYYTPGRIRLSNIIPGTLDWLVEKLIDYPNGLHWRDWVQRSHSSFWTEECRRTIKPTNFEDYEVLV